MPALELQQLPTDLLVTPPRRLLGQRRRQRGDGQDDTADSGVSAGAIYGITFALLAIVLLAAMVAGLVLWRRWQRRRAGGGVRHAGKKSALHSPATSAEVGTALASMGAPLVPSPLLPGLRVQCSQARRVCCKHGPRRQRCFCLSSSCMCTLF